MNYQLLVIVIISLITLSLNAVDTVKSVDLNRYLGRWYQIAYFPTSFQPLSFGLTTADYSLDAKGKINVVNTTYEDKAGTKIKKQATAKAWSVDKSNSKLKVRFFWPFTGDYWIVKLEKNYNYTVVSDPKQKYLWILSRSPEMDKASYQEITSYLTSKGWNVSKLKVTGTVK